MRAHNYSDAVLIDTELLVEAELSARVVELQTAFADAVAVPSYGVAGDTLEAPVLYAGSVAALARVNELIAQHLRKLRRRSRTFLPTAHEVSLLSALPAASLQRLHLQQHGRTLFW